MRRATTSSFKCNFSSHISADFAFNFCHTLHACSKLPDQKTRRRHTDTRGDPFILSGNQRRLKCNAFTNKWCLHSRCYSFTQIKETERDERKKSKFVCAFYTITPPPPHGGYDDGGIHSCRE